LDKVAEIRMARITMAGMPVAWMTVAGTAVAKIKVTRTSVVAYDNGEGYNHTARIRSPLPLCVAKTGSNHLNEEFTSLLPTGIGERF
jgi:hypothetical protein